MILSPPLHRREELNPGNRRSWWRRYLDPKGTQRGRHSNDKSSANNKSVDPSNYPCLLPPPPWRNCRAVWIQWGRVLHEIRRLLNSSLSLVESRASRNFLAPSRLFIFLLLFFLSFYRLFLVRFQRGSVVYIYMVNRQQFVHRRNNISDRDQREVVEENWRNWERQWTK